MATTIRLTVLTGPHKNRRFCFCGPTQCVIGRGADCFARFSGTPEDLTISRRHCQLDIDPPLVRVQDLGSLNGTYVNGQKICPVDSQPLEDAPAATPPEHVLNTGDLLSIDGTTLMVEVVDCPSAIHEADCPPVWEPGEISKKDCPIPC
jgi:serine/threonine-protein kinase